MSSEYKGLCGVFLDVLTRSMVAKVIAEYEIYKKGGGNVTNLYKIVNALTS